MKKTIRYWLWSLDGFCKKCIADINSFEEKIDNIEEILIFLDDLWKNDKEARKVIDKQQWDDFIYSVETSLYELKGGL